MILNISNKTGFCMAGTIKNTLKNISYLFGRYHKISGLHQVLFQLHRFTLSLWHVMA
jgi:hypothetical protein